MSKPVPSLLRGFSAPVILNYDYSESDLIQLMAKDDDPFNRWEAGQRLAEHHPPAEGRHPLRRRFWPRRTNVLRDPDPAFAAEALALPAETFLAEQMAVVDPDAPARAATRCAASIGTELRGRLFRPTGPNDAGAYSPDARSIGKRALRNLCLVLSRRARPSPRMAYEQFRTADNMTDAMAALSTRSPTATAAERQPALEAFYDELEGRAAGGGQVARGAGELAPAGHARARERAAAPSGLRPQGAEQGVRADPRLRVEPRALPRRRRRGYDVPRRPGDRARTRSTRRSPRAWRAPSTAGRSSTRKGRQKAKAALERIRDSQGAVAGRGRDRDQSAGLTPKRGQSNFPVTLLALRMRRNVLQENCSDPFSSQSARIFAARAIFVNAATSSRISRSKASGASGRGSMPIADQRDFSSGSESTREISRFSFATIGRGTRRGGEQAEPELRLVARHAGFVERGQLGQERIALERRHAQAYEPALAHRRDRVRDRRHEELHPPGHRCRRGPPGCP